MGGLDLKIPESQSELRSEVEAIRKNISVLIKKRDKLWSKNMSQKLEEMLKIKAGELHKKIVTGKCEADKYNQLQLFLKDIQLANEAIEWQKEVTELESQLEHIKKELGVLQKLCDGNHPDRRKFEDYFKCDDCGLVIDNTPPKHF